MEDIPGPQIQTPLLNITIATANFHPCEHFRKQFEQFVLEHIIEATPGFRKSIKKRIEDRLRQQIKILPKEHCIVILILNRQSQRYIVIRNSLLKVILCTRVLIRMEKPANGIPEAI